jgi:hypothetical protein
MAMDDMKSSAALEREVAAQRSRVEDTIGELQQRLSPGQIVDELLSYAKDGGGQFVGNLGHTVTANPLPAALLGVSLVWLMASGKANGQAKSGTREDYVNDDWSRNDGHRGWRDRSSKYPYATATGGLQRIGHAADEHGVWHSEFVDDSGRKYRAQADEHGNRAGHFVDDAGRMFSGFIDDAGHRVERFRDEAGNLIGETTGWASHAWHDMREVRHARRLRQR